MNTASAIHRPGRWMAYDVMSGRLPRFAGTYVVYFDDRLVYVGSSVDIANRFSEHKFRHGYAKNIITPWAVVGDKTKITLKVRRSKRRGDWTMWEIRLIYRLKPLYNSRLLGRGRK